MMLHAGRGLWAQPLCMQGTYKRNNRCIRPAPAGRGMARVPGKRKTGDVKRDLCTKGTICPENVRPTPPPGARARPDRGYADNSL